MPVVAGNTTRLHQLFQNLIANGLKFHMPRKPPVVEIKVEDQGELWQFTVVDNGIDIPSTHHGQIFQLFRRRHSKKQYAGSGVGLSPCRRIVEQHGGEIWVESELGEGAAFCFTIRKSN